MATKEERLKALEQKQAQIKAQIQALKARDTAQDRKDDTRRKVLLGGFVRPLVACAAMAAAALGVRALLERTVELAPGLLLAIEIVVGGAVYVAAAFVVCRATVRELLGLVRSVLRRDRG